MNVLRCLTWLTILAASPTWADDSALARCRAIGDDRARLACYDAIMPPASGPAHQPAAAATPARAAPAADAAASFGLPAPQRRDGDELRSRIPGMFEGWEAKTVLTLENGQAWQIADGSRAYYQLRSPLVRIVRGAVSGYYLEVEGVAQRPRVRRVK
ncbi:MAG: hypothetical protein H6932_02820 [Burkholderiaceae bacterium]|nr:hypothetical protein [Rhodoferax sp.]MCP5270143.1 hypothetical protein [Burkholderiaceae bacterium]